MSHNLLFSRSIQSITLYLNTTNADTVNVISKKATGKPKIKTRKAEKRACTLPIFTLVVRACTQGFIFPLDFSTWLPFFGLSRSTPATQLCSPLLLIVANSLSPTINAPNTDLAMPYFRSKALFKVSALPRRMIRSDSTPNVFSGEKGKWSKHGTWDKELGTRREKGSK